MQHVFGSSLVFAALSVSVLACNGGEIPVDTTATTSGTGGAATSGTGGSSSTTTSSTGGATGTGGEATTGTGGTGGQGGGEPWPTCDTQPNGSPTKTLEQIWTDNPAMFAEAWVPGVYVTAVSKNGCTANDDCQFFVQQDESYASLNAATHKSLRVAAAPSVAGYFAGIAVGDKVDLYAHAIRDTTAGKNELFFLVTPTLPGCAKVVGSGTLVPLAVTLDDLTVQAYEVDRGPLFVTIDTVTGRPHLPGETFALWDTGGPIGNDVTTVTSLSPYFVSNAAFTGLTAEQITDFAKVEGVFGLFYPAGNPVMKFEEIYARETADYPLAN
jgi:hypothetical protein